MGPAGHASVLLLFTGSSSFISESRAEVGFCASGLAASRASGDPTLQDINVLVRPHPYNCHAWDPDPLTDLPGAVFFPRRTYDPIDADNRADFFDSIYHSAAVVGINTSAMIEAAIIGRPVFSMLAEEFAGTQGGSIHFHHLLPEDGGCVRVASTIEEHVRQLSDRLRDPEGAHAERTIHRRLIRPYGIDRPHRRFSSTRSSGWRPRRRRAPGQRPPDIRAASRGARRGAGGRDRGWLKRPERQAIT